MPKPNFLPLVESARAEIVRRGIDVDASECNRFEVTKLAASRMAAVDPDVGLLYKPPPGNNCEERAVDVVCWRDGVIVDILGAGPLGPNTPLWMENANPVDPSRWRPAPPITTRPPPPPPSEPAPDDLTDLRERVVTLERMLQSIMDQWPALHGDVALLLSRMDQRYVANKYGIVIVSIPESLARKQERDRALAQS